MSTTANYRGYTGNIEWSEEDGLFFGRVLGIKPLVSYDGETEADAEQCFRDMVDAYIDSCEEVGDGAEHVTSRLRGRTAARRRAGVLQGQIKLSADFDAPLDEFREYM